MKYSSSSSCGLEDRGLAAVDAGLALGVQAVPAEAAAQVGRDRCWRSRAWRRCSRSARGRCSPSSSFLDCSFGFSGSRWPSAHCPSPRLRAVRAGRVGVWVIVVLSRGAFARHRRVAGGVEKGARLSSAGHEMTHHRLRPTEVDEAALGQPRWLIPGRQHRPTAGKRLRSDAHALHLPPRLTHKQLEIPDDETAVRISEPGRRRLGSGGWCWGASRSPRRPPRAPVCSECGGTAVEQLRLESTGLPTTILRRKTPMTIVGRTP